MLYDFGKMIRRIELIVENFFVFGFNIKKENILSCFVICGKKETKRLKKDQKNICRFDCFI